MTKPKEVEYYKGMFKDILHSLGTNMVLIPLSVVLSILLARLLGPEGKGGYDLFVATGGLLIMILGFSLPSGITYVTARSIPSLRAPARWLIAAALIQGLLVVPFLVIAKRLGFIRTFLPSIGDEVIILFCAGYVLLTTLTGYWKAILIGRQEIIAANHIVLLTRLAEVVLFLSILAILFLLDRPFGLSMVIGMLLVSSFVSNMFFLHKLRRVMTSTSKEVSGFRQVVAYSAPCYLGNLAQFLNYRLDVFFVSALIGQGAVGLYVLAVNLAQLLWLLPYAVSTVLLPKVAGNQQLTATNAFLSAQAARLSFWVSLMAGIFLSLLVIISLPMVYGQAFRSSVAPFLWLLPGVVAMGHTFVLASYIAGIGKPQINLFISLVGLLVTVTLDLLLIPHFHIVGAALASSASYSVSTIVTFLYFRREAAMNFEDVFLLTSADIGLCTSFLRGILQRIRLQSAVK